MATSTGNVGLDIQKMLVNNIARFEKQIEIIDKDIAEQQANREKIVQQISQHRRELERQRAIPVYGVG